MPKRPPTRSHEEVRRRPVYFQLLDVIVVPAALGLALGRLGNVINNELYITPLAQFIAVASPILIAGFCYWQLRHHQRPGKTTALFLILYSLSRFGEEWLRAPEWPLIFGVLTRGQLYTLPLFLLGLYLLKDEVSRPSSR
jgi:phosphatidylglycerol:prolipoprotein diacylglycerol transferase